ncbi:MAG: class I SAM-dependent methyltransferase [Candidatus Thiodiazotropha lotti]|nr:class I SAM-dependent methyltransferase [Candidatus Thiodiazotropha lotti]
MHCLICNAYTHYFFTKQFDDFGLGKVEYERCSHCGAVFATSLLQLPEDEWQSLCVRYHGHYRIGDENPDDPNWRQRLQSQSDFLFTMSKVGLLPEQHRWLDYGCGEGELSGLLGQQGVRVDCYDRYWQKEHSVDKSQLLPGSYPVVINTALFEHLRSRAEMDAIINLITEDGTFALHTLVRGEIPRDPSWFYLLPVHTIFFTNQAMRILFQEWGFSSSLYAVDSRLWLWFKASKATLLKRYPGLASEQDWKICDGFMAYWP